MVEHTCIKDDGGTALRKCKACEVEQQLPANRKPCKYPGCIAQANVDRDHCTLHYPENVAARAIDIVVKAMWPLIGRKIVYVAAGVATENFQARMTRLRDRIVDEIRRTT